MRRLRFQFAIMIIALLGFSSADAGQLVPELEEQLSSSPPDRMIPVWIKLHRLESASQLKGRSERANQTRAGRHQFVEEYLRGGHERAQADLIGHIQGMSKQGSARNLKQYWIVNVIAAEVKAAELGQLAARDDIEWIYPVIEPRIVEPTASVGPLFDPLADSITPNLAYVKADQASAMGYTGSGRVICSFDTGVDGDHPALINQWKGHDGDSAAAWFDPRFQKKFPHAPAGSHGTHTMGTMVGRDPVAEFRTGIAPDAKWISAAVINIAGTSIIDAFQWAADPDGNANTVADVPDVINHSWGYSKATLSCENIVFDLIDNTEALGIINIFASGNKWQEGAADTIVFNPANRDLTDVDCFAVGNLNATLVPPELHSPFGTGGSLGGPSDCNGGIKPNVVAPGFEVISSVNGGSYNGFTGTSMAAPHVAGLALLMREKNPNATPDEIKQAILVSVQTEPTWGSLPNNSYGWGAIDCVAALNLIGDNSSDPPTLRVYDFDHPPIGPGDTVTGTISLQNLGSDAINISSTLSGSHPSIEVIDGSVNYGTINLNSVALSSGTVTVVVSDTVTPGSRLALSISISGDNYSGNMTLYINVGLAPEKGIAHHDNGAIKFSVGNYGVVGLGPNSMFQAGGLGFSFNGSFNDLWEGGVMIGTGPTQVSSGVHSYFDRPDMDFKVIPGGDMTFVSPGAVGAEESVGAFNDDWAESPIGLTIRQHTFSYDFPNDKFVIVRYILENFSGSSINGLYFGLFLDWDIPNPSGAGSDAGGYDNPNGVLWMAYNTGSSKSMFRGMKRIHGPQSGALTESSSDVAYIKFWDQSANGFTPAEKWTSLIAGTPVTDPFEEARADLFQMMNFGPFNLANGDIDSVTIAILAGNSLAELQAAGDAALLVPTDVYDDDGNLLLPDEFTLYQNYPNPFNPNTTIQFDLPEPSEYKLSIYNVLGQTIFEREGLGRAGSNRVKWEAGDQPSGVYFYRVGTEQYTASRKMVLIK